MEMDLNTGTQIYNFMDTFFCYTVEKEHELESVVSEHMLIYVISGELDTVCSKRLRRHLQRGQAYLIRKDFLSHIVEYPSKDCTPFKGLFLQLKTPILKKTMSEYNLGKKPDDKIYSSKCPYVLLPEHPIFMGMFKSLENYFDLNKYPSEPLMEVKIKEVILTLIEIMPTLKSVLFDFAEPWKVNIVDYMEQNFANELDLDGFAHYTGRSLSSFKKDFIDAFHMPPGKWLIKRRLTEARKLIVEEGEKPMDVYWKVGFKNLSHFSTAFKREFGCPPTLMTSY